MLREDSGVEAPVADDRNDAAETMEAAPSRGRLLARRIVRGGLITLGVLALLGGVLYGLGGPMGPTRAQRNAYEAQIAAGTVVDPGYRQFVVPVPGCVCHSDDPAKVVQHSEYRIRECSSCH